MKVYNKLIRDKIPQILDNKAVEYEIRTADEQEYWEKLRDKLSEEVAEFLEDENIEELADVLEVIEAMKQFKKWPTHVVEQARLDKKAKKGGFEKRIILIRS